MITELAPQSKEGQYNRPKYNFEGQIGSEEFPIQENRYHVYLGNSCPWCHRVLLALTLKNFDITPYSGKNYQASDPNQNGGPNQISGQKQCNIMSWSKCVADPERASRGGWVFENGDPLFGCNDLREVYDKLKPGFVGRCTAPLLVDKVANKIVCNESEIIVKNINRLASLKKEQQIDLYPQQSQAEIDLWCDKIYNNVNNGVYKSGFSTTQQAYDQNQINLFKTLDELDQKLSENNYVAGQKLTLADVWLYPTLIRFDSCYSTIFRCTKKRIAQYKNLSRYLNDMYHLELQLSDDQPQNKVAQTYDLEEGKQNYFTSLFPLNASLIVPYGPNLEDVVNLKQAPNIIDEKSLQNVFHMDNIKNLQAING